MSTIDPALFEESDRMQSNSEPVQVQSIGPQTFEHGGSLPNVEIAFQTWGEQRSDNVVLICHAISGDSNAVGWWPRMVGPGRTIDTNKWFVICANVVGGCKGSTGPSSQGEDGKPYGNRFPFITIGDMVQCQHALLKKLGIDRLALVAGGSMGGMQSLEWTLRFPDMVERAFITASTRKHNAMQIAFNEVARQAIRHDPAYQGGNYAPDHQPKDGLAVARMIGHLTYLSEAAFEHKFGRQLQREEEQGMDWKHDDRPQFQVESYLNHQGAKFAERFDANSFMTVSHAIDAYEASSLEGARAEFLFTSFTSDWIYPSWQSAELHALALEAGCKSKHIDIDVPYGHDAFLLEIEQQGAAVQQLLEA